MCFFNNMSMGQCVASNNISQGKCVVSNKVTQSPYIVSNIDNMFGCMGPCAAVYSSCGLTRVSEALIWICCWQHGDFSEGKEKVR